MNVLTNTWRQLVGRRLWPVAVLLVAALAAIPVLLQRDATPVPAVAEPAPLVAAPGDEIAQPVVSLAAAEDRDRRRRVLGARKDPFKPVPTPEPTPAATPPATTPDTTVGSDSGSGTDSPFPITGTGGTNPDTPVSPAPTPAPGEEEKTYELNSLIVRFGGTEGDSLERKYLERLHPLPSTEEPLLVYLGVDKEGKHAIFMVDASVEPTGDGVCKPRPENCETIHLAEGETEFFDVIDPETGEAGAQFQLDLLDIKTRRTASKAKADAAYAGEDKGGRKAVRARVADRGPLRWDYDRETGTLLRRDAKAFKAAKARLAARLARSAQPDL